MSALIKQFNAAKENYNSLSRPEKNKSRTKMLKELLANIENAPKTEETFNITLRIETLTLAQLKTLTKTPGITSIQSLSTSSGSRGMYEQHEEVIVSAVKKYDAGLGLSLATIRRAFKKEAPELWADLTQTQKTEQKAVQTLNNIIIGLSKGHTARLTLSDGSYAVL